VEKTNFNIKRVMINDDPSRVIEFDPSEVTFVERFYGIFREFKEKSAEFNQRAKILNKQKNLLDENGMPANLKEGIAFVREMCEYLCERIDYVFGPGTSQKAFGDTLSMPLIDQFFQAMVPLINKTRSEKAAKYGRPRHGSKVMK